MVVGGLTVSTVFTLFLVPAVLSVIFALKPASSFKREGVEPNPVKEAPSSA